jgi:hypothetical protein
MSPCCLAYRPILRFEPSDNVTSRQHSARHRAVWRVLLETGRQGDSTTTHRLALCRSKSATIGRGNTSKKNSRKTKWRPIFPAPNDKHDRAWIDTILRGT